MTESPSAACDATLSVVEESSEPDLTDDFGTFYAAHRPTIERALTLTLGSHDLGQDATAEAFTRALDRWAEVQTYANPGGWLYRVGVNWARSRRRRKRREVGPDDWAHLAHGVSIDDATPDTLSDDLMVTTALSKLSLDHRIIVVGRFYLDWSEAQLADALDIAPGTVKSRSSRALARLTELLEDPR